MFEVKVERGLGVWEGQQPTGVQGLTWVLLGPNGLVLRVGARLSGY